MLITCFTGQGNCVCVSPQYTSKGTHAQASGSPGCHLCWLEARISLPSYFGVSRLNSSQPSLCSCQQIQAAQAFLIAFSSERVSSVTAHNFRYHATPSYASLFF